MKKLFSNKKRLILLVCIIALFFFVGCQSNVDSNGNTLEEKIIYLDTSWSDMLDESFFTAILVYPISQCINWLGTITNSGVIGVVLTTLLYNVLTLGFSIKSTVSNQKMQMIQPELNRIQAKYEGRTDDNSKMLMAQEMQKLYDKHGINPMGSIGTIFLQYPFMIAMYYAAQRASVVCQGTFFGVALSTTPWNAFKSLSTSWPIALIFVCMCVLQFTSIKTPQWLAKRSRKKQKGYKKYADNNTTNSQTNMMTYSMLILIFYLGLRWPASMSVYWSVSSLSNILKNVYIQVRYVDNAKV